MMMTGCRAAGDRLTQYGSSRQPKTRDMTLTKMAFPDFHMLSRKKPVAHLGDDVVLVLEDLPHLHKIPRLSRIPGLLLLIELVGVVDNFET